MLTLRIALHKSSFRLLYRYHKIIRWQFHQYHFYWKNTGYDELQKEKISEAQNNSQKIYKEEENFGKSIKHLPRSLWLLVRENVFFFYLASYYLKSIEIRQNNPMMKWTLLLCNCRQKTRLLFSLFLAEQWKSLSSED